MDSEPVPYQMKNPAVNLAAAGRFSLAISPVPYTVGIGTSFPVITRIELNEDNSRS
jgi:hypothetical protein